MIYYTNINHILFSPFGQCSRTTQSSNDIPSPVYIQLLIYERGVQMTKLEELKQELEEVEQIEPQSIKKAFEKMQKLARIRKLIKVLEQKH